jgi:hypothetical protein
MYKVNLNKIRKKYIVTIISLIISIYLIYNELVNPSSDSTNLLIALLLIIFIIPYTLNVVDEIIKVKKLMKNGKLLENIPYKYVSLSTGHRQIPKMHMELTVVINNEEYNLIGENIPKRKVKKITGTTKVLIDKNNPSNYYIDNDIERTR